MAARALCLDHLTLVDLDALALIEVAATLGCGAVSLFVQPLPICPARDLVTEAQARREVLAALRANGLAVGVVEPFMLTADPPDWPLFERMAQLAAELGGTINALGFDDEHERLRDRMGRLAEIARTAGVAMTIEAFPLSSVPTLADALALAESSGDHVGLCVDTLHVRRGGGSWGDVVALPPARIRHVQVSDAPLEGPDDRAAEATGGRLPPGQGELDLAALLPLLPDHATLAVEAPFVHPPGMTPLERGRIVIDAMRRLLDGAPRSA